MLSCSRAHKLINCTNYYHVMQVNKMTLMIRIINALCCVYINNLSIDNLYNPTMDINASSFVLDGHHEGHVNSKQRPPIDNVYIELLLLHFNRSTIRVPIGVANHLHYMITVNKLYRNQIINQHTPQSNRTKKPSQHPYNSPTNQTYIKTTRLLHYYHTK